MTSCQGQVVPDKLLIPYERNPDTPSKGYLDSLNLVPFESLMIEEKKNGGHILVRIHRLNGWTVQLFENSEHRFRYVHYSSGLADWQIGYFDNGELGHDFHLKNAMNCGSIKMWQKSGCLYIDTYFLEGGINEGPAFAWHDNCVLSRDALIDHGRTVYEVTFDKNGNIVEKNGAYPAKYK